MPPTSAVKIVFDCADRMETDMIQGVRVALTAAIVAAFLQIGTADPARAALSSDLLNQVKSSVNQNPGADLIAALRDLFVANPELAPEIAAAAVELNPDICRACALAAASAVPAHIFAVVKAMVGEAPGCANDIIDGVSEALPDFAEMVADVAAQAAVQAAAGPASGPVSPPEDTTDNREDRGSPS